MTDIQTTRQLIAKQIQAHQNRAVQVDSIVLHSEANEALDKSTLETDTLETDAWWLLGTSGCYLCNDVENMLRLFSTVTPIKFQKVDIAYLDEDLMMQFATRIPIILTPTQQLDYPFSVLDLQRVYQSDLEG